MIVAKARTQNKIQEQENLDKDIKNLEVACNILTVEVSARKFLRNI